MGSDKTKAKSIMSPSGKPPISDSPWLWLALFTAVGLAALLATGGKFGKRQSGIERRYQARGWQARSRQTGELGCKNGMEFLAGGTQRENPGQVAVPDYSTPKKTIVGLWPLVGVLGTVCAISLVLLFSTHKLGQS